MRTVTNTVLRNVAVALILVRVVIVPFLVSPYYEERYASGATLITLGAILIPVLVSALYHFARHRRKMCDYEIWMVVVFPAVSNLGGALELQQKIFGPAPSDHFLPHLLVAMSAQTLLLNISMRSQRRETAEWCLWVGVIVAVTTNLFLPWYPVF